MRRKPVCQIIISLIFLPLGISMGFSQQLSSTNISGGRGGNGFSDPQPPAGARVIEVRVWSGDTVDSLQMVYELPNGNTSAGIRHGGSGGRLSSFILNPDEYITGVSGRHGDTIDSLQFITNKRTSPVYGGRGGSRDYRIDVPGGNQALGFAGRAGDLVDAIGLTYGRVRIQQRFSGLFPSERDTTKPAAGTQTAGGRGGSAFSDNDFPQGARVAQIRIRAGDQVDAVQMVYALPDGSLLNGVRHGGGGGRENIFQLESDEYVTGISGRYGDTVDSIRIVTNKRTSQVFGGRGGSWDYRLDVPAGNQAIGFSGRAGDGLDAVGLIYSPAIRFPGRRPRFRP